MTCPSPPMHDQLTALVERLLMLSKVIVVFKQQRQDIPAGFKKREYSLFDDAAYNITAASPKLPADSITAITFKLDTLKPAPVQTPSELPLALLCDPVEGWINVGCVSVLSGGNRALTDVGVGVGVVVVVDAGLVKAFELSVVETEIGIVVLVVLTKSSVVVSPAPKVIEIV